MEDKIKYHNISFFFFFYQMGPTLILTLILQNVVGMTLGTSTKYKHSDNNNEN